MIITPRGTKIVVQEVRQQTSSHSGIIIEGSLENSKTFKITASLCPDLAVGTVVVLDLSKAVPVTVDGIQSIIVESDAVMATLS